MTDNRTTELLCKLLEERGAEYFTDDDERAYDEPARTTWDFVLCGYEMTVTATEFVDIEGKTYLEMDFHHAFTPEQAIAATLGSEFNSDGLPAGLTISDDGNLLNWRGENYVKQSTLGNGACENISDPPSGFLCSECGWGDFNEPSHLLTTAKFTDNDRGPNYCPNCGVRIRKAVER